jgi:hypothetical protein
MRFHRIIDDAPRCIPPPQMQTRASPGLRRYAPCVYTRSEPHVSPDDPRSAEQPLPWGRTPRRSRPAGHRCRRRAGASRTSPQGFAGEVRPRRGILVPVGGDRRSALRGGTDPHVPHRPRTPPLRVDGLGPTHSTDAALLFGGLDKSGGSPRLRLRRPSARGPDHLCPTRRNGIRMAALRGRAAHHVRLNADDSSHRRPARRPSSSLGRAHRIHPTSTRRRHVPSARSTRSWLVSVPASVAAPTLAPY